MDRIRGIALGFAIGCIIQLAVVTTYRSVCYQGFCRPCHNSGTKTKIYRFFIPENWECWTCSKKVVDKE